MLQKILDPRILIWKSILLANLILASTLLFAQAPSQSSTITLDEVALNAPKLKTVRVLVPSSVSILNLIPQQEVQQQLSLQEYLRGIPGLFSSNASNYAQDLRLSIRGFGVRSAFGIRGVKIIVDGIPETTPDGQGQVDNLPLGLLSKVEVLRGPSASLYGNAAGGVLFLTTLDSLQKETFKLRVTQGSYNYQNYQFTTHLKHNNTAALVYFNRTQLDGFRSFSGMKQAIFNTKITHAFSSRSKVNFQLNYTYSPLAQDAGGLTLEETQQDFRQARERNIQYDTFEKINQFKVGLFWQHELRGQWSLESYAFYSFRDFYGKLPFENGGIVDLFRNYYGMGTRLNYEKTQENLIHQWQLGIETNIQHDQRERYLNLFGVQGDNVFSQKEQFENVGVSLLDDLQWEKLSLRTGIRFDYQALGIAGDSELQKYTVLNPSIGLSHSVAQNNRLFIHFSTSFETPTLSELSANPSGKEGLNLDLKPSNAVNYEVGWKIQKPSGYFEATTFYIHSSNEILPYELEAFPGRSFYKNTGASSRYGVEVAATFLWNQWDLQTGITQATYKFSELDSTPDLKGKQLPGIPNTQIFLQLGFSTQSEWKAILTAEHFGAFFANNENTVEIKAFQKVGLQGKKTLQLSRTKLNLLGGIYNLLNTAYYDNIRLNAFGGRFYEPAPGRNFYLGFQWSL